MKSFHIIYKDKHKLKSKNNNVKPVQCFCLNQHRSHGPIFFSFIARSFAMSKHRNRISSRILVFWLCSYFLFCVVSCSRSTFYVIQQGAGVVLLRRASEGVVELCEQEVPLSHFLLCGDRFQEMLVSARTL